MKVLITVAILLGMSTTLMASREAGSAKDRFLAEVRKIIEEEERANMEQNFNCSLIEEYAQNRTMKPFEVGQLIAVGHLFPATAYPPSFIATEVEAACVDTSSETIFSTPNYRKKFQYGFRVAHLSIQLPGVSANVMRAPSHSSRSMAKERFLEDIKDILKEEIQANMQDICADVKVFANDLNNKWRPFNLGLTTAYQHLLPSQLQFTFTKADVQDCITGTNIAFGSFWDHFRAGIIVGEETIGSSGP